jgi:hypothetical protein
MAGVGWLGLALQRPVSARVAIHNGRSPLQGVVEALCYFTVLTNTLVSLIAAARLAGSRPCPAHHEQHGGGRGRLAWTQPLWWLG